VLRVGLDTLEKRRNLSPVGKRTAIPYFTDYAVPAQNRFMKKKLHFITVSFFFPLECKNNMLAATELLV
jgi:hypothetical protein